ncbi:MAG: MerR family transcriptional regulator [Candidatus Kapabacteria bacterium]|nr:MerR family transcriptional regulator [Candidatus Kapabacteria bacterium]
MNYTIDIAAQRSGLTKNVIRAWELRYKALLPLRTDSNRRLYTEEDIEKLKLLNDLTHQGFRIGSIANLSNEELKYLFDKSIKEQKNVRSDNDNYNEIISKFIKLTKEFDERKIRQSLDDLNVRLPKKIIITEIILPLFQIIGDMWRDGRLRISHEHFATAIFKNFLLDMKESEYITEYAPKIIVCTPVGQHHELAATAIAVLATTIGYNTIYLGANVPSEDIASAANQSNSKYVILSIIYPENDSIIINNLKKLRSYLPETDILVGGNLKNEIISHLSDMKIEYINSLDSLLKRIEIS